MDSPAVSRRPGGSRPSLSSMPLRYAVASTEPRTAMPRAPPTWRKVLLSAEAEPAFSRGSACMMTTEVGVMMCAMPVPMRKKTTSSSQIGVSASNVANAASVAAISTRPPVVVALLPNRSTSSRARGAKISWAAARGSISTPDSSGE